MKPLTAVLLFFTILAVSCTRRPVQKDLVIDQNSAANGQANDEMTTSPGAADAPYELQFIDTMIVHLGRSIDAAQLVKTRAQHDDLKKLARSLIGDQQAEIALLRKLRTDRYGGMPRAVNRSLPGIADSVKTIDLDKLDKLKELSFDLEFIHEIIPHLEAATAASNALLAKQVQPDVADAARRITAEQSPVTEQLKAWEKSWADQ